MTTRKMFSILLVANLLTVVLVTAAFQAGGIIAGPAPRPAADESTAFDPNLVPFVPWMMNYQGILKDSGGTPLTGQHDLTFTIYEYNQGTGYTSIWTETHTDVDVTNGLFNVELGTKGSPLRGDSFAGMGKNGQWNGDLELGVKVDGGTELSPRTRLATVPYAHRAEYVNRFPAYHWGGAWMSISPGETKTLTHNLGGDVNNYVVDVQFKSTTLGYGIHHLSYGVDYDDILGARGADWYGLTNSEIKVYRAANDTMVDQFRVRIWRIE